MEVSMLVGKSQNNEIHDSWESGKYYAENLHTHYYTSLYDELDDLRDDLRLNLCKWIDLSKHVSLLLKARGSIFS